MSRERVLTQGLRAKLAKLLPWIKRATNASTVTFDTTEGGVFAILVAWPDGEGSKSYRHKFSRQYIFGKTADGPTTGMSVQKCAVEFAKDVVRNVIDIRINNI